MSVKKHTSFTREAFLKVVCKILDDNKALDITVVNLSDKTSIADYMIIASGTSQRHLWALGENLQRETQKKGHSYIRIEGKENSTDWILVDLGTIIVHLFRPGTRQLYDLESMWNTPFLAVKRG